MLKRLALIFSIILILVGGVLAIDYYVNPTNHQKIIKYGEFVATLRVGEGTSTPYYNSSYDVPITADLNSCRVFNLSFNISLAHDFSFRIFTQLLAVISYPKEGAIFYTPWIENSPLDPKVARRGLSYPHKIEIHYAYIALRAIANNTAFEFPFMVVEHKFVTEENKSYAAGFLQVIDVPLDFHADEKIFVFTLPNNRFSLQFNDNDCWDFYLLASWNISFWQEYGPIGTYYADNLTFTHWTFRKADGNIAVNIFINNSHYLLLPTYMPLQEQPYIELSIVASGFIIALVAVILHNKNKYPRGKT